MRFAVKFYDEGTNQVIARSYLSVRQFAKTKNATVRQVNEAIEMEDLDYAIFGPHYCVVMTSKSIRWTKDKHRLIKKIVEIENQPKKRKNDRKGVSSPAGKKEKQGPKGWTVG